MTEFIIRLTDEQVDLLRSNAAAFDMARIELIGSMVRQVREALALYDELVAEAKAKSDD